MSVTRWGWPDRGQEAVEVVDRQWWRRSMGHRRCREGALHSGRGSGRNAPRSWPSGEGCPAGAGACARVLVDEPDGPPGHPEGLALLVLRLLRYS